MGMGGQGSPLSAPAESAARRLREIKSKLLVAAAVVVADAALAVAMQKDPEQGGVEHGVEDPGADAAAPAGDGAAEVHPDDAGVEARMASTWKDWENSSQRKAMATEAAWAKTLAAAPRRRRSTAKRPLAAWR